MKTRVLIVLTALLPAQALMADERLFTYSYQSTTIPKGDIEFENWATFKLRTPEDSDFRRFEFRHELEIGLTDRLQLDIYLADWSFTESSESDASRFDYDDSAAVIKINYLDPVSDPIGVASYHEIKIGPEFLELENKLLLQKNLGRFTMVYNLTLEAEWEEDDDSESAGELSQSFGVSYELSPRFFVGGELLYEIPLPDWKTGADQNVFLGPNASYRFGGEHNWWLTATALRQVTDTDDEPEWQIRAIVGFDF